MSAYLLKPIRQSEFRESIARIVGAHEQEGPVPLITWFSLQDARGPVHSRLRRKDFPPFTDFEEFPEANVGTRRVESSIPHR